MFSVISGSPERSKVKMSVEKSEFHYRSVYRSVATLESTTGQLFVPILGNLKCLLLSEECDRGVDQGD